MKTIYNTLYRTFKNSIKNGGKDTALNYFGCKINYSTVLKNIEILADALVTDGIKKGDIVSVCTVGTPEFVYLLFALNKIGAIPSMIYPTATEKDIRESIVRTESKRIFVIEDTEVCKKIKKATEGIDINIVTIPPTNSLIAPIRFIAQAKNFCDKHSVDNEVFKGMNNVKKYNQYIKNRSCKSNEVPYSKDQIAILHPTGGSTGPSKEVMVTNENVNALVDNYEISGLTFKPGEVVLDVLVPFVAYGSALLYKSLVEGAEVVQIPLFKPEELAKNFKKYKPTHFSGVPTYFESLFDDPKFKDEIMDYCVTMAAGGDGIKTSSHERINSLLKQHKCACENLLIGYGLTENYTTVTTNLNDSYHLGTIGVPLGDNEVIIYDTKTGKAVEDGLSGEICVSGRTVTKGYYKNEAETNKTFIKHDNGKIYLHTGDLGHFINVDGKRFLVFDGRIKDIIIRSGYKIYPSIVEDEIMNNEYVEECCVVPVYDQIDKHAPKVHVVLKDNVDPKDAINSINDMYDQNKENHFPEYHKPVAIKPRDSMPLTKMLKINRLALRIEDIILNHPFVKEANITVNESSKYDYTFDVLVNDGIKVKPEIIERELIKYCFEKFEEEKMKVKSIKLNVKTFKEYSDKDLVMKENQKVKSM